MYRGGVLMRGEDFVPLEYDVFAGLGRGSKKKTDERTFLFGSDSLF